MPRLSTWAERGMNTPDYVLHSHQTIRGLYAMLCGDYDKLDDGTPKGVEMLNQRQRNQVCLPAQLRQHGFSTHFLQGAGLPPSTYRERFGAARANRVNPATDATWRTAAT